MAFELKKIGRALVPALRETATPLAAVLTALVIGGILIEAGGADVWAAYGGLLEGMAGSKTALSETAVAASPYILVGLAVALGFRCGLFNIGAEGQFFMGALASVSVAVSFQSLPAVIHLPLALGAGISGGCLWGAIPGWLKARLGAHEVINTIMMNYVAVKFLDYMVKNVLRDPNASLDRTPFIMAGARLPRLFGSDLRLHAGFILAILAAGLVFYLLRRTTIGFEIKTVGQSPDAARYAGINVGRNTILVMAFGGGLAGLAGAGEVLGLKYNLPAVFSSGYGFDSIAVALLAKSNPLAVIPAAFLWGGLRNGAGLMQVRSGISIDLINVIQALVIVFVAADPVMRLIRRRSAGPWTRTTFSKGWGK